MSDSHSETSAACLNKQTYKQDNGTATIWSFYTHWSISTYDNHPRGSLLLGQYKSHSRRSAAKLQDKYKMSSLLICISSNLQLPIALLSVLLHLCPALYICPCLLFLYPSFIPALIYLSLPLFPFRSLPLPLCFSFLCQPLFHYLPLAMPSFLRPIK